MLATIILDIDGVLFNAKARIARHTKDGKTNWNAAYVNEEVEKDPIIAGAPADTRRIAEQFNIVYLTGRSEIGKQGTLRALKKHNFANGRLAMRGKDDVRPSAQVKSDWIDKLPFLLLAAIDDDENKRASLREIYLSQGIEHFYTFKEFFDSELWKGKTNAREI